MKKEFKFSIIYPEFLTKYFIDLRMLYVLLSTVFILSFGPFNSILAKYHYEWNLMVLALCFTVLIIQQFMSSPKKMTGVELFVLYFVWAYLAVIIVITVMHWLALTSVCCFEPVNIMEQTATIWIENNLNFAIRYLYFPVIYYLQFIMIKRLNPLFVIRVLIVLAVFSSLVLLLQKYLEIDALTASFFIDRGRVGGLATDPNAYALTAFLVLPLAFSAIFLDKLKALKSFYWLATFLLLIGIFFSGSRTGVVASVLLMVFMIVSTVKEKGLVTKRNFIIIVMFVSVIIVLGITHTNIIHGEQKKMDDVASRLLLTLDKFQERGIKGVFFDRELRGEYFIAGYSLGSDAPLAGWGAGGFYREVPNHQYVQKNIRSPAKDSVLNHYLMILVDFGVIALVINMMLILSPLGVGFVAYKSTGEVHYKILINSLLLSLSIFLIMIMVVPPSYFPGVLWVWIAQMAILHGLYMKHVNQKYDWQNIPVWGYFSFAVIILFLVLFGSYITTFGIKGYLARQNYGWWPYKDSYGCYVEEENNNGKFRWCKTKARLIIPVSENHQISDIYVLAANPDIEKNPVVVTYRIKGYEYNHVVLFNNSWKKVEFRSVGNDVTQHNLESNEEKGVVLEIKVSRNWIPKEWGVNEDVRKLGVAIRW